MPRIAFNKVRLQPSPISGLATGLHWLLFSLFLVLFAWVLASLWLPATARSLGDWPTALLLILATATTLVSMTRQLPGQNVALVSVLMVLLASGAVTLGALTGIPFGFFSYTANAGPRLLPPLPWSVPLLWLVILLTSRGTARLILRPWRNLPIYGFWLIGLTTLLVLLTDLNLEVYATQVKHYWAWGPTRLPLLWHGVPPSNFLGWTVTTLLILIFVTPALINKKPVTFPPDYQPLAVWFLLNGLFVVGNGLHHLWASAILGATLSPIAVLLALHFTAQASPGRSVSQTR